MPSSPREVADRLFHALAIGDGTTVAALLHGGVIRRWRDQFLAQLLAWASHFAEAENLPSSGGFAIRDDKLDILIDALLPQFGGSPVACIEGASTIADAAQFSPAVLLAAAISGEAAGKLSGSPDAPHSTFDIDRIEMESDDVAHVHFSRSRDDGRVEDPTRLTLSRTESHWVFRSGWLELPAAVHFAMYAALLEDD